MDESEKKKQVRFREPPSVPFLWELRPGFPRKDWKPEPPAPPPPPPPSYSSSSTAAALVSQFPKSPTKLVTSVPFAWEEKPGTPIPHFSFNAETKLIDMASSLSPNSSSSSAAAAAASVSRVPKSPTKLVTSIPFAWEEKPGTPIPHFSLNSETKLIDMSSLSSYSSSPNFSSSSSSSSDADADAPTASVSDVPKLPTKLIASIPFAWEEKPGTPIPHFSFNSEAKLIDMEFSSSSPSAYHVASKESSCDTNFDEGSDIDDGVIFVMEPESFGHTDPSLLENYVVASEKFSTEQIVESSCSSPASENGSSTSSCETGRSSLVGASFLESLFPIFPPKTRFLEKAESSSTPLEVKESRDFDGEEDNRSGMLRKPPTLGELIMMSRRRSYRRKVVQMSNWDLQRSIRKKEAFGCFMFASGCKLIEGLFDKKLLPRMKLV